MSLFDLNYKDLAKRMIGKTLIAGQINAVILDAAGYALAENEKDGLYRPMLGMRAGDLYTPRRRNAILTLVVCNDRGLAGACVLIRAIEINGQVVEGPGKVSQALGFTKPKDPGHLEELEGGALEIKMASLGPSVLPLKPAKKRNGNRIGDETLQKHMPAIAKKYLKQGKGTRFEDFVNALLQGCKNESDLRQRLRG